LPGRPAWHHHRAVQDFRTHLAGREAEGQPLVCRRQWPWRPVPLPRAALPGRSAAGGRDHRRRAGPAARVSGGGAGGVCTGCGRHALAEGCRRPAAPHPGGAGDRRHRRSATVAPPGTRGQPEEPDRMKDRYGAGERGAVLIVVLVLLLAMTVLGLLSLRGALMEERMGAGMYDRSLAFQAAEAALREAEQRLLAPGIHAGFPSAADTCSNGLC